MIGWIYWFALLFGLNVELVSIGIYLHNLAPVLPQWSGALAAAFMFIALNYVGVKQSTLVEAGFGAILILSFATFILVGIFNIHARTMPISPRTAYSCPRQPRGQNARATACRHELGTASQAGLRYRHRNLRGLREHSADHCRH